MRGRKPALKNVVPMRPDGADEAELRARVIADRVSELMPRGLPKPVQKEFKRVGAMLAAPTVDRFKPQYMDTIVEYCRATSRLQSFRDVLDTLGKEIYRVETRNGLQVKSHPYVAQMNETWRQWRSLVAMLGLSPTDERNLLPGQGDLFDSSDEFFT